MTNKKYHSVGEVADFFNVSLWRIRRAVDFLQGGGADVPRAGNYRLIPHELIPAIRKRLDEQSMLQEA